MPRRLGQVYTTVVKLTMSFDVADILTGHKLPDIREIYGIDPHESPIVIQASQDAADWIAAAMVGAKVKAGVRVPHLGRPSASALLQPLRMECRINQPNQAKMRIIDSP